MGAFDIISNLVTANLICHFLGKKVIQYTQPEFIILFLAGILMIVVGAIVSVTEIIIANCVVKQWLVTLRYYVELTQLIFKVSDINKLMRQGNKMRLTHLTKKLYVFVGGVVCFVVVYLCV